MKIFQCFTTACVAVVMLVSCQKEGAKEESGAQKSVTVTIANLVPASGTRAMQEGFTVDDAVKVATVAELNVLFANSTGDVIDTRSLSSGATTTEGEYLFHQIPVAATQLAVTNLTAGTTLALTASSATSVTLTSEQALVGIPVFEDAGISAVNPTEYDTADGYQLFTAGTVTVQPLLSRIEIGNIECADLNGATAGSNGQFPRFGTLTLANIGIHDTSLSTIGGTKVTYGNDAAGLTAWNAAGWNKDAIPGTVVLTGTDKIFGPADPANADLEEGEEPVENVVFAYNVAPGANVPNIILEISSATENTNGEVPGVIDPDAQFFVKSTSLSTGSAALTSLTPGTIYRVNYRFNSEDVKPWDKAAEFICVEVTVEIPNWQVFDTTLTPRFD